MKIKITPRTPAQIQALYNKVKASQKAAGNPFTQTDFCQALGYLSRSTYGEWMSGKSKPSNQALILMDILEGDTHNLKVLQLLMPK